MFLLRLPYLIYATTLFVVLMVPVFIISMVATLFGRVLGGNIIYRTCTLWADIWFPLVGIFHRNIYESPIDNNKSYIFVGNHISYLDAALMVKVIRKPLRPLGKVELGKIPVFGLIYRNAVVSVDRSNPHNRANSIRLLKSYLSKGISVAVFPEGTFNETNQPLLPFFDGAFKIAIETGTPIKPFLIMDTYSRLYYKGFLPLNPGRSRAVILKEFPTEHLTKADVPALKKEVHNYMSEKLVAYGAAWVKEG